MRTRLLSACAVVLIGLALLMLWPRGGSGPGAQSGLQRGSSATTPDSHQ